MSYTINLTNGTTLCNVSDGAIDTSHSSLTLIGRNFAGYGEFLNENIVYMLENFANGTGPANPLKGQLWWDTNNNILRVWSGSSWKISTGATSGPASAPPSDLSSLGGDLWFDTTNQQLKVYSGTSWVVVGPYATPATGDTGVLPAIMTDTSSGSHIVIQFRISGVVYAILSKDTFSSALTGFTSVVAGLNFSTTASPSLGLNTQSVTAIPSTLVVRDGSSGISVGAVSGTSGTFTGTVTATTFTGGLSGNLVGNVSATSVSATTVSAQGITASSGYSGTILTASQPNITGVGNLTSLSVAGVTSLYGGMQSPLGAFTSVTASSVSTTSVAATNVTVSGSLIPGSNAAVNLGSTSAWWNSIYGTAVHAQYADLAERYAADDVYEPGTVVELGGPAEITKSVTELSENVFGIISTNAAYLMNGGAGSDKTHPPVALAGRVPVKVVGTVRKGDRLVSAGNGFARAAKTEEITPWNVIGRSLVDKATSDSGIIEVIVKIS